MPRKYRIASVCAGPALLFGMAGLAVALLSSCKPTQSGATAERAWTFDERPELLAKRDTSGNSVALTLRFDSLPTQGELAGDAQPWADTYWPTLMGNLGTRWNAAPVAKQTFPLIRDYRYFSKSEVERMSLADRAKLSPAEKYDMYLGNANFDLAKYMRRRYERARDSARQAFIATEAAKLTARGLSGSQYEAARKEIDVSAKSVDVASWEGMCHGWAAASLAFKEPKPIVMRAYNTKTGKYDGIEIPFGSSDVKALLSFYTGELFGNDGFAGRACANEPTTSVLVDPTVGDLASGRPVGLSECSRLNAGSFHVIVTNFLGLQKRGFIANMTSNLKEIWNHPVYKFKTEFVNGKKKLPKGPKAAPTADYEYRVRTTVWFRKENEPKWTPQGMQPPQSIEARTYDYRVEIDKKGNVVGGEWVVDNAPDFLWVQEAPGFEQNLGDPRLKELQNYLVGTKTIYDAGMAARTSVDYTTP